MEKPEIIQRLTGELGYPESGAYVVAEKLLALAPEVNAGFECWWRTGEIQPLEVEGYTIEKLMTKHSLKPIAAFLTLDWLVREPEKAKAAVERGHDRIVTAR